MAYTVYVDEAGSFEGKGTPSIVGGFITTVGEGEMVQRLESVLREVNARHRSSFSLEDVHMAPLLHPNAFSGNWGTNRHFTGNAVDDLANTLLQELNQLSVHYFMSRATKFAFDALSPQARYGLNLMALMGEVKRYVDLHPLEGKTLVYISTRATKCLPRGADWKKYHQSCFDILGHNLAFKVKRMTSDDPKQSWSDVACYYLRNGDIKGNKVSLTSPDASLLNRTATLQQDTVDMLLNQGEFCQAWRQAINYSQQKGVIKRLQGTSPSNLSLRVLREFLHITDDYIQQRTLKPAALANAENLLTVLLAVSQNKLGESEDSREVKDLVLAILEQTLMFVNHRGRTGEPTNIKEMYDARMKQFGADLGSPVMNRDRTLAVRNRAYNDAFNDFRFEEVLLDFKAEADKRSAEMHGEKDDLAGKMCGTIGQALSFGARFNPTLAAEAAGYFEKSLEFFPKDSGYHNMSVNYLATLYWQARDYDKAAAAFAEHPYIAALETTAQAPYRERAVRWLSYLLSERKDQKNTPFDVLCLLRLLADTGDALDMRKLNSLGEQIQPGFVEEHPHQLVQKWLGRLLLAAGHPDRAAACFRNAERVVEGKGFTVQATSLPVLGLWEIAERQCGNDKAAEKCAGKRKALLETLCNHSAGFSAYLDTLGGPDVMDLDITREDLDAISRWMPFAYA